MEKVYATNKKARFDYEIIETMEAGIILKGYEVAAIRHNRMNLNGSYATFHRGELFLINSSIAPYQAKNQPKDYEESHSRKLLISKKQLYSLLREIKEFNYTLIPLLVYDKNGKIKIEIGVGKGKKNYDKRETIKKRDIQKQIKHYKG